MASSITRIGVIGAAVVTSLAVAMRTAYAYADAPPTAENFRKLRMCESSDNYRTNTGNGYYGAYQFDLQTWRGLGYGGRPDQAAPVTQDHAARRLYDQRGWQPWPACSQKEGLA